jgi:hypothetical protein
MSPQPDPPRPGNTPAGCRNKPTWPDCPLPVGSYGGLRIEHDVEHTYQNLREGAITREHADAVVSALGALLSERS